MIAKRDQLELAARQLCYSSGSRFSAKGQFLFAGVPLAGAHVLEVGCGNGAWAIWAALHGAEKVVGIDPEAKGSSSGDFKTFQDSIETFGLKNKVFAYNYQLTELPPQQRPFDVVIMYDVINHLDENSVTALDREPAARSAYVLALQALRSYMRIGGWLIVADCARYNLWIRLGIACPFTRYMIEWEKHQNPQVWISLFAQAGFECFDMRWSPLYPFRRLTSNWLVQFLTYSHFVLRLRAK